MEASASAACINCQQSVYIRTFSFCVLSMFSIRTNRIITFEWIFFKGYSILITLFFSLCMLQSVVFLWGSCISVPVVKGDAVGGLSEAIPHHNGHILYDTCQFYLVETTTLFIHVSVSFYIILPILYYSKVIAVMPRRQSKNALTLTSVCQPQHLVCTVLRP